jgi:MSHA biogenesis protein MshQ
LSSAGQSYTYTDKLTAPSTLDVRATDTDGTSSAPASGGLEDDIVLRSGRLKVFGASGGDRANLLVPLALQYWDGVSWVTNAADNCTSLTAANVALTSKSNALATYTASNPTFSNGTGQISIAPSASSGSPSGTVNLALHLGASGSDQSCNVLHGGSPANRPWLRSFFGSCASTADRDPGVQLKFGTYTNESKRQVHIREVR